MKTLSDTFSSGSDKPRGRKDSSVPVTAKSLLDLTAWSLQVLTTNDEMYDRRLKADLARMMGRAVPVFPQTVPTADEQDPYNRIYREGEYTDGESEADWSFSMPFRAARACIPIPAS